MKVLFAVSNEEISESIVKMYQKVYKQIISYKNVYYFNAILKEIQKDKTYDRIVISEDLEAFTHTQYDQIDRFIFDKLDSISDEASNIKGNDTPIILICSDRRTRPDPILVKIFGIGIYNAIIGNDRSVDEVCRLINRPRAKKEAKAYYKIDAEDVNYQAENENDVSEMEIQNIVAHYKKLGKNEERYVESFDNIAAQYNDTQLRIISKFLPLNVRAVIEEKSPKYQKVMSFNNSVSNNLRTKKSEKEEPDGPSQVLLKSKNKEGLLSKPVVIPSSVDMAGTRKLARQKVSNTYDEEEEPTPKIVKREVEITQEIVEPPQETITRPVQPVQPVQTVRPVQPEPMAQPIQPVQTVQSEQPVQPVQPIQPVKRGRGRPRKNPAPTVEEVVEQPVKRGRGRPRKNVVIKQEVVVETSPEDNIVVPRFNAEEQEELQDQFIPTQQEQSNDFLPGFEEEENNDISSISNQEQDDSEEEMFLPGFGEDEEEPEETILSGLGIQGTVSQPSRKSMMRNTEERFNGYYRFYRFSR